MRALRGMQGLSCKPVAARESRTSALVLQAMAKAVFTYAELLLHSLKCPSCNYAPVSALGGMQGRAIGRQQPVLLEPE